MKPNISQVLKALRKNNDKTQREVAEFLGISRQAYSRYESSIREPDMETLSKIAKFYNVTPQVFFIDDIDKLIDEDMNLVEMVARYQLKQLVQKPSEDDTDKALDLFTYRQDREKVQSAIYDYFGFHASTVKPISKKKRRLIWIPFYVLIILFAVNIGIMTLHRFDPDYQYRILNHSYVNAVTPGQNVNATMYLGIVRVNEFNPNDIQVGDNIIVYEDFGLTEYFVEKVTSIDTDNQTITSTYEDETVITNRFTDVTGTYVKDANLFGSIYYASKFNTGYVFLIMGHIILLAMYYLSFLDYRRQ